VAEADPTGTKSTPMSKNPEKNFEPIADDYAFFEASATEAEEDVLAYAMQLTGFATESGVVRMLDFGCGTGAFTARFLERTGWPRERLQLTLIEPVASARSQAASHLASFTSCPVADWPSLPSGLTACFDVILANHVFYYVPELKSQLSRLIDALSPSGLFLTAVAGRTNALFEFWTQAFGSNGREIPYHTSEDVEHALRELRADYGKEQVFYELKFPDTEENRMKILRFLLANHLTETPLRPLLDIFDQHSNAGRIEIRTATEHFTIRPGLNAC
jgi:trans-aconitate methyltransferase